MIEILRFIISLNLINASIIYVYQKQINKLFLFLELRFPLDVSFFSKIISIRC